MTKTRGWVMGLIVLGLVGCTPYRAAYVTFPVEPWDGEAVELAVVDVKLSALEEELEGFQAQQVAFYVEGREPIPHHLEDLDGDGKADVAVVVIPVPADGARLTAVCPGPRVEGVLPSGGVTGRVVVKYEDAYR